MAFIPVLEIGWLNGWIPFCLLSLTEGLLMLAFPKDVVARLFDRSNWSQKQKTLTVIGKLFSLVCIVLIVLAPLKIGSPVFVMGAILYVLGLVGLIVAILNFRNTPLGQPVTKGLYTISRHPQIVMLFVAFLGMCVAVGSWLALFALLISRLLQHYSILAEEEVCLEQYGDEYRAYLQRVPRYFLFF
jgi:protein-S-isoprenylcysteine O-methyltransferase Ste14